MSGGHVCANHGGRRPRIPTMQNGSRVFRDHKGEPMPTGSEPKSGVRVTKGIKGTNRTMIDYVRMHVDATPTAPAIIWLKDGESIDRVLSYEELDRRARCLAERL